MGFGDRHSLRVNTENIPVVILKYQSDGQEVSGDNCRNFCAHMNPQDDVFRCCRKFCVTSTMPKGSLEILGASEVGRKERNNLPK